MDGYEGQGAENADVLLHSAGGLAASRITDWNMIVGALHAALSPVRKFVAVDVARGFAVKLPPDSSSRNDCKGARNRVTQWVSLR